MPVSVSMFNCITRQKMEQDELDLIFEACDMVSVFVMTYQIMSHTVCLTGRVTE